MKHTINKIGWTGLILTMSIMLMTSCKKDKEVEPLPPGTTTSQFEGNWTYVGTSSQVTDTIGIYQQGGHFYMTCPDHAADAIYDTIEITMSTSTYDIPTQAIKTAPGFDISGNGWIVANNMYITWSTPTHSLTALQFTRL